MKLKYYDIKIIDIMSKEQYINEKIKELECSSRWKTTFCNTEHQDIINDLDSSFFKIITISFFKDFINRCKCGSKAKEISYGLEVYRSDLIKSCLSKVYPDISIPITLKEIIIAYFKEYLYCDFDFICHKCYNKEKAKKDKIYSIDRINYVKQKVPGDGHCFFYVIALNYNIDVKELRNNVANYMLDYKNDFVNSYEKDEHNGDSYEDFVENIRNTNEWADHLVIQAVQKTLNRPIHIYREGRVYSGYDKHVVIDNQNPPIMILYNGNNHYDALIKKEPIHFNNLKNEDNKNEDKYETMAMSNGKVLKLHLDSTYNSHSTNEIKESVDNSELTNDKEVSIDNSTGEKIYTKDELLQFKNDELKKLLKIKCIQYKSKDKKSLLIRKYIEAMKNIKKTARTTELSKLKCKELKDILITRNIDFKSKELKDILIEKIINSD